MTFRVGLVGTGWAVRVQAPAFKKAGFEVTGLWARDLEKGKKIAQEVGIPFVTDNVDELIGHKEVDIVAVVTPPFTHLDLAKKTLQHNKHLFLEKPMVLNVAEAKELSNVVSNYLKSNPNHVALVDHELRFLQSMRTMKQYIQEGKIGKVIHVEGRFTTNSRANNKRWYWWFDNTKGGGVLGAIGSHIIDSLQYLTNSKVTAVSGKLDTKIKEREVEGTNPVEMKTVTADDHTTALVEFNGGEFTGHIECSVITQNTKLHRFAVTGTEGTLTIDHGTLKWFHSETEEVVFTEESADVWSVGTANIARALHDFLSGQDKTTLSSIAASIDDGVYIQRVMEAILVSSEKRQWISL